MTKGSCLDVGLVAFHGANRQVEERGMSTAAWIVVAIIVVVLAVVVIAAVMTGRNRKAEARRNEARELRERAQS
jgi:heme/copper-type cytochrome/quinol oxidase subunit 2